MRVNLKQSQNHTKMLKGKRGWVKILEAFIAVLLIAGIALVLLNRDYSQSSFGISGEIFDQEEEILKAIQINETLRSETLGISPLPNNASQNVINFVESEMPDSIECETKVCDISLECLSERDIDKSVYARSVIISSDLNSYSPRQLKLFCWQT